MKIYSKEEEEGYFIEDINQHYQIIVRAGLKSGIIALGISVLGAYILNQKWSKFRQLTLPIKSFFVSSIATTALVISTDNASKKYQDSKYGSPNSIKSVEKLNWQTILLNWCSENKWKIIAGSWALSMIGSFSFLWRDKYLTRAQKLVQARMYAQGITLLVLLISAGMSIDRGQFFDSNKNNTNYDNNKEVNDVHVNISNYVVRLFDVSKQVIGAGVIHTLNVLISDIIGFNEKEKGFSNPCVWYLLNILTDTTVGIPILWLMLRIIGKVCNFMGCIGTKSGDYDGDPPRITWFIYIIGLISMKILIIPILKIPILDNTANWLLSWTISQEKLQIFFTMFFIPLIMNILQYWVIDTIIAKKQRHIILGSRKMDDGLLITSK
ncbi:hypothetical protein PMAC_003038 [Pneumocystis sp. 'macacae']|nr:hypothetical protein PMAC_003038 [Pneumocystis sp. 'macacae']